MTITGNKIKAAFLGAALTLLMGAGHVAAETTLRMVGSFPIGPSPTAEVGNQFMERVNELGKGVVQIQYIGASDVIPIFDQPEALVNGVFDVWYGAPNYWSGIVPGGDVAELSPFAIPDNGPGSDFYEFLVGLFEEKGVRYLGHSTGDVGTGAHYLSTNFEVESVADLKGRQLRVAPLLRHFVQASEAEPITLPPSDIFLAIDRGTVDGFTWPVADAYTRNGWQDVTKYLVGQAMYRSGGSVAMNLESWNNLSPEAQEILLKAVEEVQAWGGEFFAGTEAGEIEKMEAAGMEVLKLSDEAAAEWTQVARAALWDYYKGVMSAEDADKAKELLDLDDLD
ncbi:TRAP transporter substrate-binding protein DctP [Pseudohoeflea coraliihabitans]|uniref:TRAP transporter substrate-binding protein DctP n=1 Tax=Pseudohoeflea coraliihabitans TaxID=2860393 RepID=A0ABS6WJL4_9HYPH|nr:TRAP transporter substrate-binding protein DctP [Pseudohoeflea sp. DP4N28-3]MBW3095838.1 TRAP transporter substrate-binding protein DctP [Pseudohoeflea sp. DP4N28-3]